MSRTEQDWQDARQVALTIKRHIESAMAALDNYPYSDVACDTQARIEDELENALCHTNALIGASTPTWATNGDVACECQATPQDVQTSHESDGGDTE